MNESIEQKDLFIKKAKHFIEAFTQWEANLIMSKEAWRGNDGLPVFTQELYDEWLNIQKLRNEAQEALEVKADGGI